MTHELYNLPIYTNNLDIEKFSRMFNNKAQSYKFYWFEAILNLSKTTERDLSFEEIIEEMICEAWHTVTHFHLKLGPTVNGNEENFLEHAINTINRCNPDLSQNPSKESLMLAIKKCEKEIKKDKIRLTDYVPYKLLYPFFDVAGMEEGLSYIKSDKHSKLISYMEHLPCDDKVLYTIIDGTGLQKKIRLNYYWRKMLLQNYSIIQSWVQLNKAQFLQDRNPGVPGIINKLYPENEEIRKLEQARDLWKATVEVTGNPIKEIYTGKDIPLESLSIDHFVPRSYISNDELWNLIPMRKSLNSSKSNKLPSWDSFFKEFANYQYYLYNLVFTNNKSSSSEYIRGKFEKCKKNNLNAIWAIETLYKPGHSKSEFLNILEHNMSPIYEAARLQGYEVWRINTNQI